jgi:UDP-N-acetyl-D-glucosamine dehydrogenase
LPLAVTAVQRGLRVIGFDVSEARVAQLREGRSHVEDVSDDELKQALADGLEVTTDEARLVEADALFLCVPSPLGRNRQPDMSFIEMAAETITRVVRPGRLVSLESTTYPGTTDDVLVPAVEAAGLKLDEDVFVCFSPERVDPGNPMQTSQIPKVVGGVTEASGEVAAAAYGRLVDHVHLVGSARAAELTKLLENTYRAVNIALVNEMAQLAHELDIDIWEVIEAAATKPFGFQPFWPGPGVGGHCIPLDPQYLAWRARELKFATRFIDLAEQINSHMPEYVVHRIWDELNIRSLPVFDTPVLGVGIAYKKNVADDRESPSVDVLRLLQRRGARISVLDPHVPAERIERYDFEAADPNALDGFELAVVLTDHDGIDYAALADAVPVVFDTRSAYRTRGIERSNVVPL